MARNGQQQVRGCKRQAREMTQPSAPAANNRCSQACANLSGSQLQARIKKSFARASTSPSSNSYTHPLSKQRSHLKSCAECHYRKFHRRWTSLLGSPQWLECRKTSSGSWGVGCVICAGLLKAMKAGLADQVPKTTFQCSNFFAFAEFKVCGRQSMQLSRFKRHAQSKGHAVALSFLKREGMAEFLDATAPGREKFRALLTHVRQRGSRRFVQDVGTGRKVQRMIWCLAEARRERWRDFARQAKTIALHQDKGRGVQLVRFTGTDDTFRRCAGILGMQTMFGGHREIVEATREILKRFCTPGHGKPPAEAQVGHVSDAEPALDHSLHDKLLETIHMWNADGAADGQLAGHVLQVATHGRPTGRLPRAASQFTTFKSLKRSIRQQGGDLFKDLKVVNWDAAHGARRITQRPWKSDPYIQATMGALIGKKSSILRHIQNSQELRALYAKNKARESQRESQRVGDKVVNFSWAGHRYDSTTRPIGRAVLNMRAVIHTALQIARLRVGDQAQPAKDIDADDGKETPAVSQ